jgi:hypothetical protein
MEYKGVRKPSSLRGKETEILVKKYFHPTAIVVIIV